MYERFAVLLVEALALYASLGTIFAIAFVVAGVKRIDSVAVGSGALFRFLIFPGSIAFWPLLLRRWLSKRAEPPQENNPHQ